MHAPQIGLITNLSPCQRKWSEDSHHDYNCAAATSSKHHCQLVIKDRIIWKANHTQSRKDLPQVEIRLVLFVLCETIFRYAVWVRLCLKEPEEFNDCSSSLSASPPSPPQYLFYSVCASNTKRYVCHGVSRLYFMLIGNPPRPSPKHLRGTRRAGADSCFRFITQVDYPS